eukprot:1722296-Heterocapsa_arctica.AAC.1
MTRYCDSADVADGVGPGIRTGQDGTDSVSAAPVLIDESAEGEAAPSTPVLPQHPEEDRSAIEEGQ